MKVRDAIQSAARPRNLYPNYLNPKTGTHFFLSILSEFGTFRMKFAYLADTTGDPIYK